jgi:hypothetical protein
MLTC